MSFWQKAKIVLGITGVPGLTGSGSATQSVYDDGVKKARDAAGDPFGIKEWLKEHAIGVSVGTGAAVFATSAIFLRVVVPWF